MDLGLGGKVALVTGGSRGIGRSIALTLAAEGCKLALCARGAAALEQVLGEVQAVGADAVEALMRALATIRRRSPRSNISRTLPLRTLGTPGKSSCSKVLSDMAADNEAGRQVFKPMLFTVDRGRSARLFRIRWRQARILARIRFAWHHPRDPRGRRVRGIYHSSRGLGRR